MAWRKVGDGVTVITVSGVVNGDVNSVDNLDVVRLTVTKGPEGAQDSGGKGSSNKKFGKTTD
jgi:hypothetical protein